MMKAVMTTVTLASATSTSAIGQDSTSYTVRQTLLPAEFDRFVPRTALDMARQIPGFTINEGGGDRGFGQADTNVLINGRRISGKSNGPIDALGRITAGDVVRFEVIDGSSLDISGLSGQVLNVVTASDGAISGRYRYSPQWRSRGTPFRWGEAEISISGGGRRTDWTLRLRNDQRRFGDDGPEFVFDGAGRLTDTRFEQRNDNSDIPGLSGSYTREAQNGNVLNLTGEVNGFLGRFSERSERNPIDGPQQTRQLRIAEDEHNFELGADYEFAVPGGRLKLIGLYRFEHSPITNSTDLLFTDGRPAEGTRFDRMIDEAETVLRSEYMVKRLGGDWQWSLEGARNYVDIDASLQRRGADGQLQPVDFAGASSRVEEDRAESTLSYSRALTPRLQLQLSAGAEYSRISQTGEAGQTREFVRPNGFASLNWKASDSLNMSWRVERAVGQLNFFDFIASADVDQGRVNVTNAGLVPPQSWLGEFEAQKDLGAFGSITVRAFYEDVSDSVDLIPIEGGGQAPGNLDSAERYGLSTNITLLSEPLGWKGLRLDVEAEYTETELLDPLLGTPRRISDETYIDFESILRQDFAGTNWAVGMRVDYNEQSPLVRLNEISEFNPSFAFAEAFVEYKDFFGLTVRFTVGDVLGRNNNFFRTVFNDRVAGDIAFSEERFRTFGQIFSFDIEGSF